MVTNHHKKKKKKRKERKERKEIHRPIVSSSIFQRNRATDNPLFNDSTERGGREGEKEEENVVLESYRVASNRVWYREIAWQHSYTPFKSGPSSILLDPPYEEDIREEEASTWRFSYLIVDCHAKRRTSYWLGVGCYTLLRCHSISRVSSRRRKNMYIYIYIYIYIHTHTRSSVSFVCKRAPRVSRYLATGVGGGGKNAKGQI